MKTLITIEVIFFQLLGGLALGLATTVALGTGNEWELVVLPLVNTVIVWGIPAVAALLRSTYTAAEFIPRLIGTVVGSAIGVGVILITPPLGLIEVVFPLIGAVAGYYAAEMIRP